jgi:hypothetical protein
MDLFSLIMQEAPLDTMNYMVLGYTVIFGVIGTYLISLVVRNRNLKRDFELLEELVEKEA